MEENNSYVEKYIKTFVSNKIRVFTFVFSLISVICSLIFMSENRLNAITTLYIISMLFSGIIIIIHIADIYDKNKYCEDLLIGGLTVNLIGVLLRVIQLGIFFSIRFFVAYCAYAVTLILLIIKFSKNKSNETTIIVLLSVLVFYCFFEFFYRNALFVNGFIGTLYRIAEAMLFLAYIGVLLMNKNHYQEFSDNVKDYKTQIPSLKICVGIFALIAIIAIGIGGLKNINSIIPQKNIVQKNEKVENKAEDNSKNEKVEKIEKTDKTEKNEEVTNITSSQNQTVTRPIKDGDKIETDDFDFTLNKVELTYEVKPENTSGVYTSYPAESGKIYVHLDGSYYNKSKRDVCIRDLFIPSAEYDEGYSYSGFVVVDDDNRFNWVSSDVICTPLETCHYHGIIECPEIVGNTEAPLKVTFKIGNAVYEYTVR